MHIQRPYGVEHGKDHYAHIGEYCRPHVGYTQRAKYQAERLYAKGKRYILVDYADAFSGYLYGLGYLHGVVVHKDYVGGLYGGV